MHMSRLLAVVAAISFALCSISAQAQSVAFTFDDGPNLAETPRLSAQQRNAAMLAALAKHKVKAALFVTATFGATKPEGNRGKGSKGQCHQTDTCSTLPAACFNKAKALFERRH